MLRHTLTVSLVVAATAFISAAAQANSDGREGRVALMQFKGNFNDKVGNVEKIIDRTRQVAKLGAEMVVFPELAVYTYKEVLNQPDNFETQKFWCTPAGAAAQRAYALGGKCINLDELDEVNAPELENRGWSFQKFKALARELGIYLIVPTIAKYEDRRYTSGYTYSNMLTVYQPNGEVIDHVKTSSWSEDFLYKHRVGKKIDTFETPFGRYTLAICNGIFKIFKRLPDVNGVVAPMAWVSANYDGYQLSADGSMQKLADMVKKPMLIADWQRRTSFTAPGKPELRLPDNNRQGVGNSALLVDVTPTTVDGLASLITKVAGQYVERNGLLVPLNMADFAEPARDCRQSLQ